jgi:prevent-host-death family protein
MKTIGAFSAKTHLADLLKQVARGESFVITRRGKPVASLAPLFATNRQGPKDLVEGFRRRFSRSLKPITTKEIDELKSAGRR